MTQKDFPIVAIRNQASHYATWFFGTIAAILFLLHWGGPLSVQMLGADHLVSRQMFKLFWLEREYNVPSWYSSCLLWTCGIALLIIAAFEQPYKHRFSRHWFFLGLIFLLISMDEAVAIHEWTIAPIREYLGVSGIFYFAWIIPALVLLVIGFLAYIPFLLHLPRNLRTLFLVSAAFYISGAIGLEMAGGAAKSGAIGEFLYPIVMPIEESFEMAGLVLFLHGLIAVIVARREPNAAEL